MTNTQKGHGRGVALYRLVGRARSWASENVRSLKAVTWGAYQYRFGWGRELRKHQKRTKARWLWCEPMWVSVEKWGMPRFEAWVCDGMGEHYGYPRHRAYLLFWWRCHGYAFGVEFNAPNAKMSRGA